MASGGMYDHIGGGFARYSVDREWLVPHFEKMLYDQALLVRVYAHAAVALDETALAAGRRPRRSSTCCATCARPAAGSPRPRTPTPPGPTATATRASSTRGRPTRCDAVLGDDADAAARRSGASHRAATSRAARSPTACTPAAGSARSPAIEDARRRLFEAREHAPAPGLDDKVLTEWNALMMLGARRGRRRCSAAPTGSTPPPRPATSCASSCAAPTGAGSGRGTPTASRRPPRRARRRPRRPRRRLHPAGRGDRRGPLDRRGPRRSPTRCSTTSGTSTTAGCSPTPDDGEALVARQKDLFDNATPSANSTAAVALYRLAALTGEARYANHADRIMQLVGAVIDQAPTAFSNALAAVALHAARHHRGRRRRRPPRPRRRRQRALASRTSCWRGASRTTRRCGTAAPTASPTSAGTTPARRRRTPRTACAPSSLGGPRCQHGPRRGRSQAPILATASVASGIVPHVVWKTCCISGNDLQRDVDAGDLRPLGQAACCRRAASRPRRPGCTAAAARPARRAAARPAGPSDRRARRGTSSPSPPGPSSPTSRSSSALSFIEAPVPSRSTHGDSGTAAAGTRDAVVAQLDHGRHRQAAAGRVARHGQVSGGEALVEQPAVGGDGVLDRGRVRVLGRAGGSRR